MKLLIAILLTVSLNAQVDKDGHAKHFYACMGISMGVSEIVYQTTNLDGYAPLIGGAAAIGANEFKENIWDGKWHHGVKTLGDRIVGFMGAVTGMFLWWIVEDLRNKKEQRRLTKLIHAKEILN